MDKPFDIEGTVNEGCYTKLDSDLFDAVRRDSGIEMIDDNTLGEDFGTYDPPDELVLQLSERAHEIQVEEDQARKAR